MTIVSFLKFGSGGFWAVEFKSRVKILDIRKLKKNAVFSLGFSIENMVVLIFFIKNTKNKNNTAEIFKIFDSKYYRVYWVCEKNWHFDFSNRLFKNTFCLKKNTNSKYFFFLILNVDRGFPHHGRSLNIEFF